MADTRVTFRSAAPRFVDGHWREGMMMAVCWDCTLTDVKRVTMAQCVHVDTPAAQDWTWLAQVQGPK